MTRRTCHVSNLNKRFFQTSIFINYWKPSKTRLISHLPIFNYWINETYAWYFHGNEERMPNTIEIRNFRVVHLLYLNFNACVFIFVYFTREKRCSTSKQGSNDLCFRLVSRLRSNLSNGIRTRIVNHEQDVWPIVTFPNLVPPLIGYMLINLGSHSCFASFFNFQSAV